MWKNNIQIDYDGVQSACGNSDNIQSHLAAALEKGLQLKDYVDRSQLAGQSVDALKAVIDLTLQLQKDLNGIFEKHADALSQLESDMEEFAFHEEVTKIKNL